MESSGAENMKVSERHWLKFSIIFSLYEFIKFSRTISGVEGVLQVPACPEGGGELLVLNGFLHPETAIKIRIIEINGTLVNLSIC